MNNLPAQKHDVWTPATETDKLKALASLGGLPSRQTSSAEFDEATFFVALDGVTRWGLGEAVKAILKGSLGHAFFPSPPELRIACDKAMHWHERMADQVRRLERDRAEWQRQNGDWRPPTKAEKARVAKRYEDFCKGYSVAADAPTSVLDPEMVAKVPDNPKAKARLGQEPRT